MALDASIYGNVRQPEQLNPLATYGHFLQAQGAQQQNRLLDFKMQEAERARVEGDAVRDATRQFGTDTTANYNRLLGTGSLKAAGDYRKSVVDQEKDAAETAAKRFELAKGKMAQFRDYLTNVTGPQAGAQWVQAFYADPDVGPIGQRIMPLEQAVSSIPTDPQGFNNWRQQQALGATKFMELNKPTVTTRNLGGTTDTIATEGLTGNTRTVSSVANTQSPDSIASNTTSRANNAATVAATMRGQDMLDARARETTAAAITKPFEITGEDGKPVLVQQDKQGNIKPVAGFSPKQGASKPLTEGQGKALLFGSRMQEANDIFDELERDGKTFSTPGSRTGYGVGAIVNTFNSAGGQRLDQAKRDFINAVLRRESGAVISDAEFDNAEKQYFPQPGDGAGVITQKRRNRELATRGVLAEVPDGDNRVAKVRAPAVPAAAPAAAPASSGWGIQRVN